MINTARVVFFPDPSWLLTAPAHLTHLPPVSGDADALWRVESVDEEFDILEFFYPSEVPHV